MFRLVDYFFKLIFNCEIIILKYLNLLKNFFIKNKNIIKKLCLLNFRQLKITNKILIFLFLKLRYLNLVVVLYFKNCIFNKLPCQIFRCILLKKRLRFNNLQKIIVFKKNIRLIKNRKNTL